MVEGDADTAPAEEGVLFLDREVGQRLVTADIQAAHGHRQRMEGGQLLTVDDQLFLLAGKALVHHERHLGAVQANALGATLLGPGHVGEQAGVDPQRHAVTIQGLAGQTAQGIEALGQLALLLDHVGVLLAQQLAGVGEHLAVVAVDDQLDAVDLRIRQVDRAHHRGDTHGAGENRHMGVARAEHRHQADELALGHLAEHGRRQLLADQDAVVRVFQALLTGLLQIGEQAPAEVLDVGGTLAQVGVVHQFEAIDVLADHLAQGALGPLAGADDVDHLVTQGGVFQHHQVHVEQRALFRAQLAGHLRRKVAHVRAHPFQGGIEQRQLGVDVVDGLVGHHFQVGRRQHHHRGADRGAGRTGHADELGFLDALALATQAANRAGRLGMGDHPGELRAHGHQEGLFALVELAALLLLDDQHAHHPPVVNDR